MAQKAILLCFFAVGCIFGVSAQLQCQHERDEVAAGRNCERACRPDDSCRKQNRECICDGRCGPVCLRKICSPPLAQPGNGSIIYSSGSFIGSEATYICDDGFEMIGNAARICQANKTWSGTDPTCQKSAAPLITAPIPSTCERLQSPLNGREISVQRDSDVVAEGTVASFQCNDGYARTSGNLRRICREDGSWSGSEVVCSAVGQCERNDQEIQNQNRRCVRQCESHNDCLRGRPCVCDDICGLSCIPIDRTNHCDHLSSDQSVRVRITPNNRTFGSIARYECRNGYNEEGGSNERKCLGSGQWGGHPLTCIPRVHCEQPPEVANSAHNGTKTYYVNDDIVLYRCNFGYYRSGYLPLSRCNRDEWSEIQFHCSPKSCGDPGLILNGRRIGASFVFLGSVEYVCNPGYELRGLPRRFCQADQQWSGSLPTCHPISCPDPGVPDDGFKIGSDYSYDEIVSYDCNTRYILEGQSSIRCQANATWSAPRPTCRLIQCRRPDDPPNGSSDASMEHYGQQGTIRFECDRDYTLRGSRIITCNEREQWSPDPPLCLGRCRVPSCPTHGEWTISNGGWYGSVCPSGRMVDPGFRLTYRCNQGYFKCQQIEPVCNDRVWEPQPRNLCVRVGCRFVTLRDPRLTASYTYGGTNECFHPTYHQQGSVIEYSCNPGYKIRDGDPSQATCRGRSWSPQQQPICVEVMCPYISFPHGSVTYQQNGPFTSNRGHTATARFNCLDGYTLEGHTLSCDNGVWNDTTPTCVEEPCYVASLERYNMDVQFEIPPGSNEITAGRKTAGTTASFICRQRGFEASQTKRCERGRWRGADPVCLRIPCDDETLDKGVVTYTLDGVDVQEPVHGVIRSYNCNAGYTVGDDEPSECDVGSWTRALPVCNENPCRINDLSSEDWDIVYNHPERRDELAELMKPPRTVATFTCNKIGYVTAGNDIRTCRQGEWDGQNPSCARSTCPSVQLENGILEYRDHNNRRTWDPRHGGSMRATCNEGYYLEGTIRRLCWEGQWANGVPSCLERPCNTNDLLDGDWDWEIQYTLDGRNVPEGSTMFPRTVATLRCNTAGYETVGSKTRTCSRGQWSRQNPSCERRTCPSIQLENGRFEYRDSDDIVTMDPKHGDSRNASCDRGYYLQGKAETQCLDGQWENELPTCLEQPCNKTELPTGDWDIEFNYLGRRDETAEVMKLPGTMATFRCIATGYVIDGDDTRSCIQGQWNGPMMSCERSTCQTLNLEDGRLRYYDSEDTRTLTPRHGDYRVATCNEGYFLEGTSSTLCLEEEWIDELPTCQESPKCCWICFIYPCRFLNQTEVPDYLQVTYTTRGRGRTISSSEGSVPSRGLATFTCREEGFLPSGESQRMCRKGTWRGEFPECVIANCSIETIDNGDVTRGNGDLLTQEANHGDRIRFSCEQGYTLAGEEVSLCHAGQWIPDIPTCVEASCLAVENNGEYENVYYQGRQYPPGTLFPANTQLEVDCAEGRVPEGPRISVCRRGLWDPPRPLCLLAAPCEEVATEEGRTIVYTDNSGQTKQHRSGLTVTCENNMFRFGSNSSTCLNGAWSPPVARCKENLALRKHAYQDSSIPSGDARKAVDGNTDGYYLTSLTCSHTYTTSSVRNTYPVRPSQYANNNEIHWWYVDLGSSVLVQDIVIYNRLDRGLHTRLLNAKVRVGNHTDRDVIRNHLVRTVNDTTSNPIHIEVNPATRGRIVSISELYNSIPLTLCEVQVFGELPACYDGCEVPLLENGYFTRRHIRTDTPLPIRTCYRREHHIYARCRDGLTLQGSYYYTCQESGEWEKPSGGDATCQRCANRQCVVPYIENGHYRASRGGEPLVNGTCLDSMNFLYVFCDGGIQPDGRDYYLCNGGEFETGNNNNNNLSSCSREQDQTCPSPEVGSSVKVFFGSDYSPLNEHGIFSEGDFITSRCQDPKRQKFEGTVVRRCEDGQWTGRPARCVPSSIEFRVDNTAIQTVTENGTIIVYPVSGYVAIVCSLTNGAWGIVDMSYEGSSNSQPIRGYNRNRRWINNPSQLNNGKYICESNRGSHSITVSFEAITCPSPEQTHLWTHERVPANRYGRLGHVFTENVTLTCPHGYISSNPVPAYCTHHGTWTNMPQTCVIYNGP